MLPDVDGQQRLQPLGKRLFGVGGLDDLQRSPSRTSQAQPLPNWVTPAFLNSFREFLIAPQAASIFAAMSPHGAPPPPGLRHFQ